MKLRVKESETLCRQRRESLLVEDELRNATLDESIPGLNCVLLWYSLTSMSSQLAALVLLSHNAESRASYNYYSICFGNRQLQIF